MATILTKKKDTSGAPSAGDLTNSSGGAELAVNTADKRLYTKDSGGNVVEVGINPTSITTGTLNTSGAVVFNDAGADVDFRVEGDTDANLLFVDASADAVGIGTSSPAEKLHLVGNMRAGANSYIRFLDDASRIVGIGSAQSSPNSDLDIYARGIGGGWSGNIKFYTSSNSATVTERMRITSDGYVRLASGTGGIQFGGDTAAANALDDYEEGTWTPTVIGSGATGTYETSSATGTYTKIGRQVTVNATIQLAAVITGGGTGGLRVSGLPFNAADTNAYGAVMMSGVDVDNNTINITSQPQGAGSNRVLFLETWDNASNSSVAIADVAATDAICFSLTYNT